MKYTKLQWWLPKLLCLIAAFAFWVYVMDEQNPMVENSYTVPIEVRNLDKSLVTVNMPKTVRVRVRMSRSEMIRMTAGKDIKAYVDLADMSEGEHPNTPVQVVVPSDQTVISQTPAYIDLVLDAYMVKTLPAKVVLNGQSEHNYTAQLEKVVPDTITIAGAASAVNQADRAVVSVNVTDKSKDFTEFDTVNVLDANGNSISGLDIMPSKVKVSISVKESLRTKSLPLRLETKGTPADGYTVGKISINPMVVNVTAPVSFLDAAKEIKLDDLDVSGASSSITKTVSIPVPDGGDVNPASAEITVNIDSK